MVTPILLRSSLRFYRQHPLQLLLSVLGIVLGVCIVTAVWITNSSSKRAFALSTEALYGRTTHHIVAAEGVAHAFYVEFRKQNPALLAAPVIEGHALIDNNVFSLIGIDPFSELPFGRISGSSNNLEQELGAAMLNASGLLVSAATGARLNMQAGDELPLRSGNSVSNCKRATSRKYSQRLTTHTQAH